MHGTLEASFRVEWRPLSETAPLAEPWVALAGRALEPNVFYEPAFARASPGVQLILETTRALLADRSIVRVDSCATAGHPMIDHIWRERLALADHLVRPGPRRQFAFALACTLERARRAAIACAKRLRDRLRA